VRAKEFDFDQLLSDTQDKVRQPLGRRLRKADCMSMLVCSIQMTQIWFDDAIAATAV
jgi:hypothetical protein